MPLTVEQFTPAVEAEYIGAVAVVANIRKSQVSVASVTASSTPTTLRRLLEGSVDVETDIEAEEGSSLQPMDDTFTTENYNRHVASSSSLPAASVGRFILQQEVQTRVPIDFEGASSYAEAVMAIEFDAVSFMQYWYAQGWSYVIDNLVIMNFLGESDTHYTRIRNEIAAGGGFDVEKQGSDQHYTMTPTFGAGVLCPEVGDTDGITTGHLKCFWRNAIVKNEVQPVAAESMYLFQNDYPSDAADAKAWIQSTVLGGGSAFNVDTANEYFARTCPRSNDTSAETRSYGCLFIDPGYRWISRVKASGPTSPFTVSDKTIVAAVVTMTTDDGTVVRRRLLSSPEAGAGMVDIGPAVPAGSSPPARHLLSTVDPAAKMRGNKGTSMLETEKTNVNAAMNLAYLSGMQQNDRWQNLEISTVSHRDTALVEFAGNVRAVMLRLKTRMGSLVKGLHVTGFEGAEPVATLLPASRYRRLLAVSGVSEPDYTNVDISAIVQMDNNFGNIYVNELECALSALADQSELLRAGEIEELVALCERGSISAQLRDVISMRLSSCAAGMTAVDKTECNQIRGVLAVMPGLAPPDTNGMVQETPALIFGLNLEIPLEDARADTAVSDMLRQTVADVLNVSTTNVLVLLEAAGTRRRLLAVETVATVFVYKDMRAVSVVNTGPHGLAENDWVSARGELQASFAAMPALGMSGNIVGANRNPQTADRPSLPAVRPWVLELGISVDPETPKSFSESQGQVLVSYVRAALVAQFPTLMAARDVSLHDLAITDWGVQITVWLRFETEAAATAAGTSLHAGVATLRSSVVQLLHTDADETLRTVRASHLQLDPGIRAFNKQKHRHEQKAHGEGGVAEESASGGGVVVAVVCGAVALVAAAAFVWWWRRAGRGTRESSNVRGETKSAEGCVYAAHGVRDTTTAMGGFAMFTRVPVFEN
jgi:hypothetical protein